MSKRTFEELQIEASMWWPIEIKEQAAQAVDLPRLLDTQTEFLSLLLLAKKSPLKIFDLINASEFPANLFLKHLVILTDFCGEPIKRLGKSFTDIFPKDDDGYYFDFPWFDNMVKYRFEEMPINGLSNAKLAIDGVGQKTSTKLNALTKDMIAILMFAGLSNVRHFAGLDVCQVGQLLGDENKLVNYVKQKYIVVSRITGGTMANKLGQIAQNQVVDFLKEKLDVSFNIKSNGKIILSGYSKKGGMPFDVVVDKGGNQKIGIEISFQVTTNSTIERKAGQAVNRQNLMHQDKHFIAYVLDGAGNFERWNAFTTIINNSDCTVTFSEPEFEKLVDWIKMVL